MQASHPDALRADARNAVVQSRRLRAAGDDRGAQTFDRWTAMLNARAAGITDPEELRAIARSATRATAR
jgi:hypothetical protein